jgi:predicted translin family RNA/ssDNA-binding protein
MSKWDYDLKFHGAHLRELITQGDSSKENCENILQQIINCCEYLQKILTDEDKECYEFDLEEMIEDCNDTKYYLEEYDEDFNEREVDSILSEFYDLMDSMRVWVAL